MTVVAHTPNTRIEAEIKSGYYIIDPKKPMLLSSVRFESEGEATAALTADDMEPGFYVVKVTTLMRSRTQLITERFM